MSGAATYFILFFEFFKIGLFSVGGGLATLPFLYQIANNFDWLKAEDIPNMLAAAQFLPGAIGINIGAYTGFHVSIAGAYIAVLGMVTPQIAVITVIARVFEAFKKNVIAARIFAGLTPAAAGLLSAAGFNIWKISLYNGGGDGSGGGSGGDGGGGIGGWGENFFIDIRAAIIFVVFFILIHKIKKIHPAFFIASAGVLGVVLKL